MSDRLSLNTYRHLGRSGLRVSPIALGTMTFGETWGAEEAESRRIFDLYVDRGGNFIDTANMYARGASEDLVGKFAAGKRDSLVIATKYSLTMRPADPNASGNHRKNMMRAVEDSLRRLNTDYIDLYYLHVWDGGAPVEEIMRAFDDLVRQGKIVYVGISDTPAWQVSRMQMLAELRGWSPFVALQIEYSLIERTVERELIPMARELGLGVLPWSPLASGLLSGKYTRADIAAPATAEDANTRKAFMLARGRVTDYVVAISDLLRAIGQEIGATPAQVALAWTLANPAVCAPIIGARTLAQFQDNIEAVGVTLDAGQLQRLNDLTAIEPGFPHSFLAQDFVRHGLTSGAKIQPRS